MGRVYTLEECKKLPPGQVKSWCYNALDVTGTREVADVLLPRMNPAQLHIYAFERALQNPTFDMMQRGVLISTFARSKAVNELKGEMVKAIKGVNAMPQVQAAWNVKEKETGICHKRGISKTGKLQHHKWPKGVPEHERHCEVCGVPRLKPSPFNANSPDQTKHLFYGLLGVPPMRNKKKEISVDEDVLFRIGRKYPKHRELTSAILHVRDIKKQIGSLNARLTPDNRYPSVFNVGGAWTGRLSSNKNPYGEGGNLQNWAERHRYIAIPDPGMIIGYADLKTAESMAVAFLSGDEKYIEAHKGDTHTFVTRLLWPGLPWTGDLKKDKVIAKSTIPEWDNKPGHDMRFQSKSVQHGSNFLRTPRGIAIEKRIPVAQAESAQNAYFNEFPYIRGWQNSIKKTVEANLPVTNPLGREVHLLGRPWDMDTIRQGVSFKPQSIVADIINIALWRVWRELEPQGLQPLAQVHDAILFQFPEGRLDLVRRMAELMTMRVKVVDYRGNERWMTIPVEIAVGKNWGHKSKANPHGLEEINV